MSGLYLFDNDQSYIRAPNTWS